MKQTQIAGQSYSENHEGIHMNESDSPELTFSLHEDWASALKHEIQLMGYIVDPKIDYKEIAITYFNLLKRRISSKARKILVSKEFICPPDLVQNLEIIKGKVTRGDNLVPHQSTRLNDPNYDDALLNDWDINHLHLGITLRPDGFVERTGPVLFARVTDDIFYMICIMEHGPGNQPWIQKKLLEAIHKNWPESIAHRALKGVVSVEFNPTDQEIGQLRKGHVFGIYQMDDGTVYVPPGGGATTSGRSADVMNAYVHYTHLLNNIELYVRQNIKKLMDDAVKTGAKLGDKLHFRLVELGDSACSILEENGGVLFRLPFQKRPGQQ
jgi:hypothetical protein